MKTPLAAQGERVLRHWPLLGLLFLAGFFLFADLGGDYFWSDEGDTAVLARSILKHGVPKAWDGVTFTDSDFGMRVNRDLVMVSHPWMQYYATAASFFIFGETPFAARFPFALAALLTVPLLYLLVIRLTSDRRAALSAAILLCLSVQFLLFSRQCRNYALTMFLACLLIGFFFRLTTWKGGLCFAVTAILLFHCNPAGLAPLGALAMLSLIHRPFFEFRKWLWCGMPLIALATVPWILFAQSGYKENTTVLRDFELLAPRLTQFLIEYASVAPLVGVIVLFIWLWVRSYRQQKRIQPLETKLQLGRAASYAMFRKGERSFFVISSFVFFSYAILIALTQSRTEIFNYGLRYATPLIPLTMGMIGILISKVSRSNTKVWLAIMVILGVTKFGRITPWSFLDQERTYFDGSVFAAMHVPKGWTNKIFRTALISFVKELWHDNRGTVAFVSEYLNKHADPKDILITNYGWEPMYFHTRLAQGLKIMPSYPIYQTARMHNLPEYVFGVEGVRWVVWRWAWEGYRGYEWDVVARLLAEKGAVLTKVATVCETTWENRPELHFHRYPNGEYKYGWFPEEEEPDAEIYRVDWPAER